MGNTSSRRERPKLEFIQPAWLRDHTFGQAGNAILHDLEEEIRGWDWIKSDADRRQHVIRALVELGSELLVTASRELREDVGARPRSRSKPTNAIEMVPLPSRRLEEAPA